MRHVQCSGCGGHDHFRKDCCQDNFCTRCRSRSHATHMCRVTVVSVWTVAAHTTPWEIAPASPTTTTGRNSGQHHGISTVMDHIMEQILNIWEYPEEMHGILQIPGQHLLEIWEITSQLVNRCTEIIQMYLSLTEIIDMTKIELDVSKQGLMRDTTNSTLLITTITNHPSSFCCRT